MQAITAGDMRQAFGETGIGKMMNSYTPFSSSEKTQRKKEAEAEKKQKKAEKKDHEDSLKEMMRKIMKALHYIPGERSFKTFLWRDYGVSIGRKLISRLMKEMNF